MWNNISRERLCLPMNSKLKKCKTCGAEVAKSAKTCPNCGANLQLGVSVACGIVVLVTFFVIFAILVSHTSGTSTTRQAADPSSKPETIKISATDLWRAYDANSVSADSQYKGQLLTVTGKITNIGQDLLSKDPCISLASGDQFGLYPVQCFFPGDGDTVAALSALHDGQTVTITGKCAGVFVAIVQLTGCSLTAR